MATFCKSSTRGGTTKAYGDFNLVGLQLFLYFSSLLRSPSYHSSSNIKGGSPHDIEEFVSGRTRDYRRRNY
eukprot:5483814-Ditylum_brightwellii.AAC.1